MNILAVLTRVSDIIWSAPVIFALFMVFLYISWKAGFPQRYIPFGLRTTFSGGNNVYKSLSVSLAAVLGVGNIVGVALAISLGGAGAVFWCWLAGLVGVGVQYAECLFSLKYRSRNDAGKMCGGPMYTMRATGNRGGALLYAVAACLCGIAMGALTPANSICEVLGNDSYAGSTLIAAGITVLTAIVILGGAKTIFEFCAGAVPVMIVLYVGICLSVLFICREQLGNALSLILKEAFQPVCAVSGVTGYGIGRAARWGVARGLFSSEAGMGTAGISAAAAGRGVAAEQAIGCACSTVWDTLILAAMTGVTFVAAALHGGYGFGNALALADNAFALVPVIGRYVLPVSITILGFSTIVGWYYIAEQAYRFLFSGRAVRLFSFIWIAATFFGGITSMDLAWTLSDILCVFMMAPNLFTILRLLPSAANDAFKLKLLACPPKKYRRKDTFSKI